MTRALHILFAVSIAGAAGACDPYDPDLGDSPFRCGTDEPRCPRGYECVEQPSGTPICEAAEGEDDRDGGPDDRDASEDFECNNDAEIEPNESINDATITPVPDIRDDYPLVNLAICPSNDIDTFRFRIDQTGKTAIVDVYYQSFYGTLQLDLLNSTGVSIAAGTPVGGDTDHLQVNVPNLPMGVYYYQVQSQGAAAENNYDVTLTTSGP